MDTFQPLVNVPGQGHHLKMELLSDHLSHTLDTLTDGIEIALFLSRKAGHGGGHLTDFHQFHIKMFSQNLPGNVHDDKAAKPRLLLCLFSGFHPLDGEQQHDVMGIGQPRHVMLHCLPRFLQRILQKAEQIVLAKNLLVFRQIMLNIAVFLKEALNLQLQPLVFIDRRSRGAVRRIIFLLPFK